MSRTPEVRSSRQDPGLIEESRPQAKKLSGKGGKSLFDRMIGKRSIMKFEPEWDDVVNAAGTRSR